MQVYTLNVRFVKEKVTRVGGEGSSTGLIGMGVPLAVVPDVPVSGWELEPVAALDRILAEGVGWLAGSDGLAVALLYKALETSRDAEAVGSIRDRIAAQQNVARMLASFGFEPYARSRLGLTTVQSASKLEQLRQEATRDQV